MRKSRREGKWGGWREEGNKQMRRMQSIEVEKMEMRKEEKNEQKYEKMRIKCKVKKNSRRTRRRCSRSR